MPEAILFAGNARRFVSGANDVRSILEQIGISKISVQPVGYAGAAELESRLNRVLRKRDPTPVLIAYLGHGDTTGWALDDTETFLYRNILRCLRNSSRRVLLISDCCHSGALPEMAESIGGLSDRISIIASCQTDQVSFSGMTGMVVRSWATGEPFVENKPNRFPVLEVCFLAPFDDLDREWPFIGDWVRWEMPVDFRETQSTTIRWGASFDEHFFPR